MPRFAANLSLMFNELGFLERFAAARAAHFDGVEFLFPYAFEAEQIVSRLQRYQLELALHNFPAGDWAAGERGLACDPRRTGEFQDTVELALEWITITSAPARTTAFNRAPHAPRRCELRRCELRFMSCGF